MDPGQAISERKRDHLDLAVATVGAGAGWDEVLLVPRSLPGTELDAVDLTTSFLGRELAAPLVIVPMTGGHPEAAALNAALGEAAQRLGLAVGVGSQRAALVAPSLAASFAAVRERAPDALVIGNVGACQLVTQGAEPPLDGEQIRTVVAMVGADALSVHLNVVQELIQTEGDRATRELAAGIASLIDASPVPVLVKETGAGMTREDADELVALGVAALDVGGSGGTGFARIEAARADRVGDERGRRLGAVFADWGVPTPASVLEVRGCGVPVVATGGVRHGLDAARALALGADLVGIGRLAIDAVRAGGVVALMEALEQFLEELRVAMVLSGAPTPAALARRAPVLTGATAAWASSRRLRR